MMLQDLHKRMFNPSHGLVLEHFLNDLSGVNLGTENMRDLFSPGHSVDFPKVADYMGTGAEMTEDVVD